MGARFSVEQALTNSERDSSREVQGPAGYEGRGPGGGELGPTVVKPRRWERGGDGPSPAAERESMTAGAEDQDAGATAPRDGEVPGPGGPADLTTKGVNQSLARIEMNSLEVKLFLDSIDQRISRMEPRLEEIRGVETGPTPVEQPAGEGLTEAAVAESLLPTAVEDLPVAGPTTERRRRAQGVPTERRRTRYEVPGEVDEEPHRPWRQAHVHVIAFARRRWIAVAGVALMTLLMLVLLGSRTKPPRPVAGVDAGPAVAAAGTTRGKDSADVPWETDAGRERRGSGRTGVSGGGSSVASGRPVVEQGVRVPQSQEMPSAGAAAVSGPPPSEAAAPLAAAAAATTLPGAPSDTAVEGSNPVPVMTGAHDASGASASPALPGGGGTSGRVVATVSRRVNVSSGVMAGNLLFSPQPAYPKGFASIFHPQGEVVMQAIISRRGRVENLRVISGHMMLRGAAKDAVRAWRYRPYTVNGSAVEVATIVSVEFHR